MKNQSYSSAALSGEDFDNLLFCLLHMGLQMLNGALLYIVSPLYI